MSDRLQTLKVKIASELSLIHYFKQHNLPVMRAYERLARIENELYVRRKLTLERVQSDIEMRKEQTQGKRRN